MDRIQVEGVSKRYALGEQGNLRETLSGLLHGKRHRREDLWSLRDVSFTVPDGGALGMVGRNGAGKSTILKVLMGITTPTEGVSRTRGRVAALLEVGTGFHPELTGRENVFLNAAILGMSRRDTARRFDEIVAFAGTERFLDTPVKRYSSGMYLRLAFAVAAHLEPDVLIVDEVLAVGDAEFQRRCVGRMAEAEGEGRTVVFVSHDLTSLQRLCAHSLWLEGGRVRAEGPTTQIVRDYLSSGFAPATQGAALATTGPVHVLAVRVEAADRPGAIALMREDPLRIAVEIEVLEELRGMNVGILVSNTKGVRLIEEALYGDQPVRLPVGRHQVVLDLPPVLNVGEHVVGVWIGTATEDLVYQPTAASFELHGSDQGRPDRGVVLDLPMVVKPL